MKKSALASALVLAVLGFGSSAYADGDGFTAADRQQVYQTAEESNVFQSNITASIPTHRVAVPANEQLKGRDLTNSQAGN